LKSAQVNSSGDPISKKPITKKKGWWWWIGSRVDSEFKPQYCKKTNQTTTTTKTKYFSFFFFFRAL
jgi:hypothetical protein